mmetsp:Transcript_23181/g.32415  ORF Transcript_23181/g.32415 Transcript_23181/m.32415 type:complete len:456 (+) Transcript_23181:263-1630(+)|eukprot:CAMPEP_0185256702 /NCGR_PEP_ID=MMETSP1359-20130426/5778_1 /TAXON_ID=552665 /ORGANISM="Bigelowiella longifila, Strain CCMP242" /LENGTH=455 /DNA_ID=CAMNT_0027841399 /DNA_START=212 /DNA_END=1579 /DNA_ORIENTATION=+
MRLRHASGLLFGLLLGVGFVRFHIAHNHPQSHRQQIKGDHTLARRQHNRHGSPISVGACSPWDETELASYAADKKFATTLVDLALPNNKWVRWVNLTGDGLPLTEDLPFPDMIFCLSGSYAHSALMTRIVKPPEFGLPVGVRSDDTDTWVDGVHYPDDMSFIKHMRGRPLLVGLNTDPWNRGDCQNLDIMLDTKLAHPYYGCPSLYLPYALLNLISAGFDLENTALMRTSTPSLEDISKKNFCVLLCNPCRAHPMAGDGLIMWAFLSVLGEKYKKCDIIGDCQREAEVPQMCTPGQRNSTYVRALKTYSKYRFVISFETAQVEGWFSEQIILAAAVGSIPIFWGDEGIGARLNENRIFNMNDYISEEHVLKLRDAESMDSSAKEEFAVNFLREDMNKAIDAIRGLNENNEAFQKVASLPLVEKVPSSSSSAMQLETVATSLRSLLQHLESFTIEH